MRLAVVSTPATSRAEVITISSKSVKGWSDSSLLRIIRLRTSSAVALRRLTALDSTQALTDLLIPPGNRLETLQGDRQGQHSIRINDQYRICFTWKDENVYDAEIAKRIPYRALAYLRLL